MDIEERLRSVEHSVVELKVTLRHIFWLVGAIGLVLTGLLGYTSFWGIPSAITAKLTEQGAMGAVANLKELEEKARKSYESTEKAAKGQGRPIGRLQMERRCVAVDANNCNPVLPACSTGFEDTGLVVTDTYPGGRCGRGSICRVCYRS